MFIMICTAVMTGAALGIVSNFDTIVQQAELVSAQAYAASETVPDEGIVDQANQSPAPTTVASNDQVSRSTRLLVITAQEKDEIKQMMQQLGMEENQREADFIMDFQRSHNLTPTGNLDSQTLNLMIKQATYNKASHSAQTVTSR